MVSTEKYIQPGSDFYVYTAGALAQKLFLYPMIVGSFHYMPGYRIRRLSFDSFLLMYIRRGQLLVETDGQLRTAYAGNVVFLDCYQPHAYGTDHGCEVEWLHFDGANARGYYEAITQQSGPVITLKDSYRFEKYLHKLYLSFRDALAIRDPLLNNYIVNVLTELLLARNQDSADVSSSGIIDDTIAYITEHLQEELSLEQLARQASLSPFYFSRLFKKETGYSPHEYVIQARVTAAKYFLQSARLSQKDICYSCGFSSESSFCTTFKKSTGLTPSQYRKNVSSERWGQE